MSNKVIQLKEPSVDEDLLKMAESIVNSIKAAEITDLFAVVRERGGSLSTYRYVDEKNRIQVLGYLEWSKWCLLESIGHKGAPMKGEEEE